VVDDAWQRRGLGRIMMQRLIEVARERGLKTMIGYIVANNQGMLALCMRLGFAIEHMSDEADVRRATLTLAGA
jgi:acetyltransferase